MDKTDQILESLKAAASSTNASLSGNTTLNSTMEFITAVGSSLINNPLFYLKVLAVAVITVMIIMVSIHLVTDS